MLRRLLPGNVGQSACGREGQAAGLPARRNRRRSAEVYGYGWSGHLDVARARTAPGRPRRRGRRSGDPSERNGRSSRSRSASSGHRSQIEDPDLSGCPAAIHAKAVYSRALPFGQERGDIQDRPRPVRHQEPTSSSGSPPRSETRQSPLKQTIEDDRPSAAPVGAPHRASLTEVRVWDWPSVDWHLVELVVGEIAEPLTVRREERTVGGSAPYPESPEPRTAPGSVCRAARYSLLCPDEDQPVPVG